MAYSVKLGLDIGGVLSTMSNRRNTEIWEYVDKGAYVFLCAFIGRFGRDNLCIVTRTNQGVAYFPDGTPAWTTRFVGAEGLNLFGIGWPSSNYFVVRTAHEKGPICEQEGINVFVDNSSDVLVSIHNNSPATDIIYYDNDIPPFSAVGQSIRLEFHAK